MRLCPNCGAENSRRAKSCVNCGGRLPALHTTPTDGPQEKQGDVPETQAGQVLAGEGERAGERPADRPGLPLSAPLTEESRLYLYLSDEVRLTLSGRREYFIGRADPKAGWYPQVDLTPYGGEPGGVSRRHARIFLEDGQPYVEDMGSLNGTFINTVRLITRVPYPLRDADRLAFGKFEVVVGLDAEGIESLGDQEIDGR